MYNAWCARALGSAQYADFAAALGIVAILGYALNPLALVTAQLASGFFARGQIARVEALYRAMQQRLALAITIAAIPAIPLAFVAAGLFRFGSRTVLLFAGLMVAVLLLLAITRATLRATQRFGAYTGGLVGESVARLALGVPLLWISPTASYALAAYLASAASILLVHDRALRRSWSGEHSSQKIVPAWDGLIGPSWALLIWYAIAQNADLLIIKSLAAGGDAGIYAAAATIVRSLMMVLTLPLDAVLLPRLGAAPERPRAVAWSVGRLFLALWIPPVAALVLFPRPIITLAFGPSFAAAAPLVPWLAVAAMCMSGIYLTGQALLVLRERRFLIPVFGGLALEVALLVRLAGDLYLTSRTVFAVQGALAFGAALLWMHASSPARLARSR